MICVWIKNAVVLILIILTYSDCFIIEIFNFIIRLSKFSCSCIIYIYSCIDIMYIKNKVRGARGVIVIVVGNGHSDMSSNPGRGWLHFTKH